MAKKTNNNLKQWLENQLLITKIGKQTKPSGISPAFPYGEEYIKAYKKLTQNDQITV